MILIICMLYVVILLSCVQGNDNNHLAPTNLQVRLEHIHPLMAHDVYDSIQYVPLEFSNHSMIQGVDKLYRTDSGYVIFDSKQMNILLFGSDGKFKRMIGQKGEGQDEYSYWNDMHYDRKDNLIYAHERFQNCIYVYALSGNLQYKTQKSSYYFNSFVKTSSGFFVYSCFKKPHNPDGYNLLLLDEDLQVVKRPFFPQDEFINAVISPRFFVSESGQAYFYYPSANYIYEMKNEEVAPFCQIDFGKQTLPYDEIVRIQNVDTYEKLISDKGYLGDIQSFKMNDDWLYFECSETDFNKPVKSYYCMYNRKTENMHIDSSPFFDQLEFPFHRSLKYIDNTAGIYLLYPFAFTEESLSVLSDKVGTAVSDDSNPILVVAYLKK